MTLSLSLGPLALPVAPLLLAVAVGGAGLLAARLARPPRSETATNAVYLAAACGLLVARLAFLAEHADLYREAPLRMLDLRDGGWHLPAGVAGALAGLMWRAWRQPEVRRPVLVAGLSVGVIWLAATMGLQTLGRAPMPTLALQRWPDGQPTDLRTVARGRPAVINLWASWCGPCREEMPMMVEAQRRHPEVAVLFVNQGEAPEAVRQYLATLPLQPGDVLLDPRSTLGPAVGSAGLPTTLFYDATGHQVAAHMGVLNAPALEARLRAIKK